MDQNIFQVINENHLEEIINQNRQTLIVIMLSSKECPPCKTIKPKFITSSKQNKDIMYIYIDRTNYTGVTGKYLEKFLYTPTFIFYFNCHEIGSIEGAQEQTLITTINDIKQKIDAIKQEVEKETKLKQTEVVMKDQPKPVPHQSTDLLVKKMEILNMLRELIEKGHKLSKNYNLDSEYEEMLFEYQYQTSQQMNNQQPNKMDEKESLLKKKQEQVKQIQELDMLHQKMQMESFKKLQQLRRIQMMKEQHEKNANT
jgi:thiol-disulfide isomerase/thioredoxin